MQPSNESHEGEIDTQDAQEQKRRGEGDDSTDDDDDGFIEADWLSFGDPLEATSQQEASFNVRAEYEKLTSHGRTGCFDEKTNSDCVSFMLNILSNPSLYQEATACGLQTFPSIFGRMRKFTGPIPAWVYLPARRKPRADGLCWVPQVPALIIEVPGQGRESSEDLSTTIRSLQFGGKGYVFQNSGKFRVVFKVSNSSISSVSLAGIK